MREKERKILKKRERESEEDKRRMIVRERFREEKQKIYIEI